MRYLILGTAGHVDHGKTELVRALTGHDTDRLKEEKERGISIELGFAPLPLDDNHFLGLIDVPGHERFVKHMVAGAGGLDLAMLLVAADEGVMPQTEEHMEVLKSLSISGGLVVISKCDLASDDTMEILKGEVAELTAGTFLEGARVIKTSAKTGEGIEALRAELSRLAALAPARDSSGPFRQPVDRVFHQKGIGVVVTGTCYSGRVAPGDSLELLPGGRSARVRALQSFGRKRDQGRAGERLAIALQGVKLDQVSRGDVLATPGRFTAATALDVRARLASYHKFEVKNRERVRVHHGAREVLGRIVLLEHDVLRSGENGLAQLKLESPLVTAADDHIVIRKYSPSRVIGGGVVLDPNAGRQKRFDQSGIERLELREQGDPADVLLKAIESAGLAGVSARDQDPGIVKQLVEGETVVRVDRTLFHGVVLDRLARAIDRMSSEYVRSRRLRWGVDKEELRQKVKFPHGTPLFNRVLDTLCAGHPIFVRGNRVRSGSKDIDLPAETKKHLAALDAFILKQGMAFPRRRDVEAHWSGNELFVDAVDFLRERGRVVEVGDDGLVHKSALDRCVKTLDGLFSQQDEVSVGDVKEALGLTRKHTIPILEMFDANRITTRVGNARARGPKFPTTNS